MASRDIHSSDKFKNIDLVALSTALLEREFKMVFEVYTGKEKVKPDLTGGSPTIEDGYFLVQIGRNRLSMKIAEEILNNLDALAEKFRPSRIILMNYEYVEAGVEELLKVGLVSKKGSVMTNLIIYDSQMIHSLLNKNKDIKERFFPGDGNDPKPGPKKVEYDKIPFHLDQVEQVDRLNREPIAGSLANLLNDQIFSREERIEYSFMIHLQGAWGEGKSTFMQLLGKKLNSRKRRWVIIELNAWQNQHLDPPWWSFLDKIYKQGIKKIFLLWRPLLRLKEGGRRLISYKRIPKLIAFSLTVLFGVILFLLRAEISEMIDKLNLIANGESEKELDFSAFAAFIGTVVSFIGLIYSLAKFLSYPFFLRSSEDAKTFINRASDPMEKIRRHFNRLVGDFNLIGYNVAIFIDDLDRCEDKFTVRLLEGIHTLFKGKPVLYVVAGDRHWIINCFENHYSTFKDLANEPGQRLGYLFLEKAFQLSIRLPKVSGQAKKAYWEYILSTSASKKKEPEPWWTRLMMVLTNKKAEIEAQRSKEKQHARDAILEKIDPSRFNDPEIISNLERELGYDPNIITEALLEVVNEDSEDVKHLLAEYYTLIDTNPRSIKRLANQYTMHRDMLYSERQKFDKYKLFRWLIIQNRYPVYTDWLERNIRNDREATELPEELNKITTSEHLRNLILDPDGVTEGNITEEDIRLFSGIYTLENSLDMKDALS